MCHVNITWCSQWYSTSLFGNEDHIGLVVSLFCNLHISIHEKKIESKRERERKKEGLTTSLSRIPSPLWKHLHFRLEAVNGIIVYWSCKKSIGRHQTITALIITAREKLGNAGKLHLRWDTSRKPARQKYVPFMHFLKKRQILFSVNKYLQKLSFLTKQSYTHHVKDNHFLLPFNSNAY